MMVFMMISILECTGKQKSDGPNDALNFSVWEIEKVRNFGIAGTLGMITRRMLQFLERMKNRKSSGTRYR